MTESTEITSLCSYTEYEVDAAEPNHRSVGLMASRARLYVPIGAECLYVSVCGFECVLTAVV